MMKHDKYTEHMRPASKKPELRKKEGRFEIIISVLLDILLVLIGVFFGVLLLTAGESGRWL